MVMYILCSIYVNNSNMAQFKRERNRIHAKLTRDRKKLFATRIEVMINFLEGEHVLLLSDDDDDDVDDDDDDDDYTNTGYSS